MRLRNEESAATLACSLVAHINCARQTATGRHKSRLQYVRAYFQTVFQTVNPRLIYKFWERDLNFERHKPYE